MPRKSTPQKAPSSTGAVAKKRAQKNGAAQQARSGPKSAYLPPPRQASVDDVELSNYGSSSVLTGSQKQGNIGGAVVKKKKKPRAFKKKIIPEDASPYMKFRLEFMNKYPKLMRGKSKSERTNIIKKAWGKKQEKPTDDMTPYILFRTKFINEHRPEMKGMSKREKTAKVKAAWKDTSAYQKFKLGYICKHYADLQKLTEKEKTKQIKEAWGEKKKELIKGTKGKIPKGVRKVLSAAKIAENNLKDSKRKEKKHKEWLRKLGRTQVPVPEGEKVSDYIIFRYGYMDLHRSRFEHMKEKDRTAEIKAAWLKQKKKEEIRAIARITKRKREEVVKREAEKVKKTAVAESIQEVGAYKKGELTPYQIYRAGYRLLYGLDASQKSTTDKIKAAWKEYQAEYLKSMQEQMKRDKDLLREKKRLKRLASKRKKRKRSKSPGTPRPKSASNAPTPYMKFRQRFLQEHKAEFHGMTEREITAKVKIAWWEDAPNRKSDASSSGPAKKKSKPSASKPKKIARAVNV
eukprot:g6295.t1